MPHNILSSALVGIDSVPISVQIDSSSGLHAFTIVGLGDKAVQESIDRVESAIKHSGFVPPRSKNRRYIVNLAPADLKKEGPGYDLPIAVAYLVESGQVVSEASKTVFVGELGLDGSVTHTNGVLAATLMAKEQGASMIVVPFCNRQEAQMVPGIEVFGAHSLVQVVTEVPGLAPSANWHKVGANLAPRGANLAPSHQDLAPRGANLAPPGTTVAPGTDDSFAHIRGQYAAKRALIIGAAGGHNVLMSGSPGSGKTILARSIISLLPPLAPQEAIEVAKIHSAAGLLRGPVRDIGRPFCSPHHTSSPVSVIGGGSTIRPGQVSLAHRGVLFMDEMPEFARNVLEALRQPLEDGIVTVSRASGTLTLPAKFMLVGAMNPCPCGNAGNPEAICTCTTTARLKYVKRLSGPLLDRMDMQLFVSREKVADTHKPDFTALTHAREAIADARARQAARFADSNLVTNSEISHKNIEKYCVLTPAAKTLLTDIVNRRDLSLRAYHKVQKVARTIADVSGADLVDESHIAEALTLRISDRFAAMGA